MDDTDTLLAGLQDIRLPADAPGGLLGEMLAVVGLAFCLALLVSFVLRAVLRKPDRVPAPRPLPAQISALRDLSEDDRVIALLGLIRTHTPGRLPGLRSRIYGCDDPPRAVELEALLMASTANA